MKLLILNLFVFSSFAFGNLIEEELFIDNPSDSLVQIIGQHPELTIDHRDEHGMELYGPKGTKAWLDMIQVEYEDLALKEGHHEKDFQDAKYPTFEEIEKFLKDTVAKNPKIAKLFSIGKSVEGRDLWVVKISDNVELDEAEPEFKFISSMHGNEITGRELTQFFIKDVIEGYGVDSKITNLVNNTEIFIMPSMNPDGSLRKQRGNARGFDLNRDFPDWTRGDVNSTKSRQPETIALMNFQKRRQFSLSANFHGGAEVVNYPWDSTYDLHPFDNLVKELSLAYAEENPSMRSSNRFPGGVTNGAKWYVLHGGMQDWSYFWHNDLQVTIELSIQKWPNYNDIPSFYKSNKDSMLVYLESIHQGAGFSLKSKVSGRVQISKVEGARKIDRGQYGFSSGEFYKVLPEGEYEFQIQRSGSMTKEVHTIMVDSNIQPNGNYLHLN